jgi:hypothetical protein
MPSTTSTSLERPKTPGEICLGGNKETHAAQGLARGASDPAGRPPWFITFLSNLPSVPFLSLLLVLSLSYFQILSASTVKIAATASARDFLAGDAKGTAVTADGKLTLGAPFAPRAWPENAADAVAFAAVSDAAGRIYVATGGGLGRLFVSEPDGKISLLFTASEPNLTAVALAPDGAVLCASSPNGKIYRVDPKAKDAAKAGTIVGEPGEAAIWALAVGKDGTIYAGTGNKGRIFRKAPDGKLELFRELEDVHVRCLALGPDGTVYAGTSDRGLVVALPAGGGPGRTLHDFSRPEVVGIAVDAGGLVYAAATTAEAAAARSSISLPGAHPSPTPTPAPSSGSASHEEAPRGSVSIATLTSRTAPTAPPREGSGEVVVIQKDGFVEPAWVFPEETLFAMRLDAKSGGLLLATGPRGRVYSWSNRHVRLEAQTGEKQVVAVPAADGSFAAVTMGAPGVFRQKSAPRHAASFTSAPRDATRVSTFGRLRWEGEAPGGSSVTFSARSGNSDKPDATWSPWTPVSADATDPREGGIAKIPAARFFQWKAELIPGPKGEGPTIERVEFSYVERNARPVLENLTVLEPGAVYGRASSGAGVLSVTNPDENGIYSGLEAPREGALPEAQGRRYYRKSYRTVSWKGTDPNGDTLRYDLEACREGGAWFPVRRDLEDSYYSFDTSALPDGRYRFRVTASDRLSHPEGEALTATEETGLAVIDNTPPVLKVESKKLDKGELEIRILATDALSPVTRAEGSVNADRWRLLEAEDGAADSPAERFVFRVPKPAQPAVLSVRVLDASGNWAAVSVEYPKDFP